MPAYFKGNPVFGPRGPSGPDGNPIGTVISFMGTEAPKDYLVCDGAEYSVSDYPDLADFFRQQFGAANHFGGDGAETFAVPDLRNLFLRGYHGEAEEQLSGDIGAKQEATEHVAVNTSQDQYIQAERFATVKNYDTSIPFKSRTYVQESGHDNSPNKGAIYVYTARPVNMAVLYCIKAVESLPAEYVYSREERRIGTWIDGKPLYQGYFEGTTGGTYSWQMVSQIPDIKLAVEISAFILEKNNDHSVNVCSPSASIGFTPGAGIDMFITNADWVGRPVYGTAIYTKITD